MEYDLVFEGGGAKGMVFVGALQAFEAEGHTPGRLLGTSAGAITAALLAAGYTSDEMLAALAEREGERSVFAGFMGVPEAPDKAALQTSATRDLLRRLNLPFVPDGFEEKLDDWLIEWMAAQPGLRHVISFIERGGWYSADNFLKWLRRRLDSGSFKGAPRAFSGLRLAEFHAATGVHLSLVASDVTAQQMLVLNHQTAPRLPVVMAVRMSMSIPLLWQEVIWDADWGPYRVGSGPERDLTGHAIVDGGLLSNFPLELLVSSDERVTAVMGPKSGARVLGMLIDEAQAVPGADEAATRAAPPSGGLRLGQLQTIQRLGNLVNTTLSARDKMVIETFENLVVRLPARGYGTVEFDMTDERRERLVAAGREVMAAYLEQRAAEPVSFAFGPEAERARDTADKVALKALGGW